MSRTAVPDTGHVTPDTQLTATMFKFTTIYRRVDDEAALEAFFASTHLPLAEKLPGLIKSEVSRISGKPGGESRFHLMYELYFESDIWFQRALMTPAGLELMTALQPWADAKVISWFFATAYEEETAVRSAFFDPQAAGYLPPRPDEEE